MRDGLTRHTALLSSVIVFLLGHGDGPASLSSGFGRVPSLLFLTSIETFIQDHGSLDLSLESLYTLLISLDFRHLAFPSFHGARSAHMAGHLDRVQLRVVTVFELGLLVEGIIPGK